MSLYLVINVGISKSVNGRNNGIGGRIVVKSLSQELRDFAFREIDDPIAELDRLAERAKNLEMISGAYRIITEELGQAVVSQALENYLNKQVD